MRGSLNNRLDKLEAEMVQSRSISDNVRIQYIIVSPDRKVVGVLETIIENGVVICSNSPMEPPWPELS